ncbi:MAG TPA: MarR family transcriptional regulator [Marmoricola sp.]|nr:MarR family transcriptional regulator [Marmoricola sp.]
MTTTQELGSDLTLYAARLVRLLRREHQQPVGMRVLSVLDEAGPLGVTQLAAIDQCSQPTMTGTVNGLVERGWVSKRPDPADARSNRVELTGSGRRVLAEARRVNGSLVTGRLASSGVSEHDLATAVSVLRTILDNE